MLVLSRHVGESIVIADNIIVTILEIRYDGKVRIGITAPRDIIILREELIEKEEQ